jgi:hypothetical protein
MADPPQRRLLHLLISVLLLVLTGEERASTIPDAWSDAPEADGVARHAGARPIVGPVLPDIPDPGPALPQLGSSQVLHRDSPICFQKRRHFLRRVSGRFPTPRAPPV